MRTSIYSICALTLAVVASGYLSGCDKEIARDEKTSVSSDGTVRRRETVIKESPDGTIIREDSKSRTRTGQ